MNTHRSGNMHFLYDATLIDDVSDVVLFDHTDERMSDSQAMNNTAQGRGAAVFFRFNNLNLVYKHYQRGGLIANLLHDHYFGIKLDGTRSFREWNLLHQLRVLGLPCPVPVAARVIKSGLMYKADMVTKEIEGVTTLADLCMNAEVENSTWCNIGRCIKQFHDKNVYHADLNARNILVGEEGDVYLIDFDKSHIRVSDDSWKVSNLSRLNRSLMKFKSSNDIFHYAESHWDSLLDGYNQ